MKIHSSVQFLDNAKPMSRIMRSLCQDNAKPMSKRIWKFCRVKVGWVSKVVRFNAKPMSRICAADVKITRSRAEVKPNGKPMSR